MIPNLVYYQLVILVCSGCASCYPTSGRAHPVGRPRRQLQPITPKRKRSNEPKAFAGLTHKPHCVLCEQETGETAPAPPVRPDPMPPTNRRPRTVDTSRHFCPHSRL